MRVDVGNVLNDALTHVHHIPRFQKGQRRPPRHAHPGSLPIQSCVLTRPVLQETEKATKPAKGKKNTGVSKRPLSAYMFFAQDWRERIKAENPDAEFCMCFILWRSALTNLC